MMRVQVMVHETWLGEYLYSEPWSHQSNLTATGISIDGAFVRDDDDDDDDAVVAWVVVLTPHGQATTIL